MAYFDSGYTPQVYKKYVDVLEIRRKDGSLEPKEILYDNKRYKIDKFEFKQYGSSRTGSGGKHYTIWIKGHRREMFLEKDKWFIETGKPPAGESYNDLSIDELNDI